MQSNFITRISLLARGQGAGPWMFWGAMVMTVATAILLLRTIGWLEPAELYTYDRMLAASQRSNPVQQLLIVEATEQDLRQLGYPFSDQVLAKALQVATEGGATAVAVDMYRDMPVAPGTEQLQEMLARTNNLYWVYKFGDPNNTDTDPLIPAPKVLDGTGRTGFADFAPDTDGRVRRMLIQMQDASGRAGMSLSMRMALHALQAQGLALGPDPAKPGQAKLGRTSIAPLENGEGAYRSLDAAGYQLMMSFQGVRSPIERVRLADVVNGRVPAQRFAGKLVFIGITAVSLADYFYTPVSNLLEQPRMAGVALHAYATAQLMSLAQATVAPIRPLAGWMESALIVLAIALGCALTLRIRSVTALGVAVVLTALTVLVACLQALGLGYWLPAFPLIIGFMAGALMALVTLSVLERSERKLLMDIFSLHVSKDIAEALWHQRHHFMQHGRAKTQHMVATVIFTDIAGFTAISQKLPPAVLFQWLGEYLSAMTSMVETHQGVVNKFIGDSIMAVFGIPLPNSTRSGQAEDAVAALHCALAMAQRMQVLNQSFQERDLPPVSTRIGIHSGELVAGSVGSGARQEYTVLGDSVNVASRLESLRVDYQSAVPERLTRIFVSGDTYLLTHDLFEYAHVGSVELKGRVQHTEVYELIRARPT